MLTSNYYGLAGSYHKGWGKGKWYESNLYVQIIYVVKTIELNQMQLKFENLELSHMKN